MTGCDCRVKTFENCRQPAPASLGDRSKLVQSVAARTAAGLLMLAVSSSLVMAQRAGATPPPRQVVAHPQSSGGTRGAITTATSSMVSPGLGPRATLSVGMRIIKPR